MQRRAILLKILIAVSAALWLSQACLAADDQETQLALLTGPVSPQPMSPQPVSQKAAVGSMLPIPAPTAKPADAPVAVKASEVRVPDEPAFALGAGDALKVTVWGYPELSEQVAILPDGTVSYPLIGVLRAQGLTARELAGEIGRGLAQYLVDPPTVSVVVGELKSRRFSVIGDVPRAGMYPLWSDDVTILEALAQAGGLGAGALPAEVKVLRVNDRNTRETIPVNLNAILDESPVPAELLLKPGDIVYVPSQADRRKVCVLGEVQVPGLYTLTPKMTVVEALTAAGWAKSSGVLGSVMVIRRAGQGEQEFFRVDAGRVIAKQDWSQDLPLMPGDIVYVPEHLISKIGDFVNFFSSSVEPAAHAYLRVYDATNPASVLVDR